MLSLKTQKPPIGGFENGSPKTTSPEPTQIHKKIELSGRLNQRISDKFAELYRKGHSLSDISRLTGKAKSTIQANLIKAGVELRPNRSVPAIASWKNRGKNNVRPPYGFCYFQGKVIADPKEYENLLVIHQLWKDGVNPNAIADQLNAKKIKPRKAAAWNRNSIVNILHRFKSQNIVIQGGNYELR